jgi:hypothetical protein
VRPIFQLSPGGPGFIPVPGLNDSELFWKPGVVASPIKDIQTRTGCRIQIPTAADAGSDPPVRTVRYNKFFLVHTN